MQVGRSSAIQRRLDKRDGGGGHLGLTPKVDDGGHAIGDHRLLPLAVEAPYVVGADQDSRSCEAAGKWETSQVTRVLTVRPDESPCSDDRRLALRVLRSLASSLQPVLLAFLHPGVASQKAGLLEHGPELRVVLDQGAGDAVRDSARLAAGSPTHHLDADVELALRARDPKWSQRRHLEDAAAQVRERVFVVDHHAALAGLDAHARNGVLAPAGGSSENVSQS